MSARQAAAAVMADGSEETAGRDFSALPWDQGPRTGPEEGTDGGASALLRGAVRELRTDLEEVLWLLVTHTGLEASIRAVASEVCCFT